MNRDALLKAIKAKAKQDEKNRRDLRFLEVMGFLIAKGFLRANFEVPLLPNKRLRIDDAIWSGQNVEPRILEVLPAAVLRLGKHFDLDIARHQELVQVVDRLRKRQPDGEPFFGIPYVKIKLWGELPLKDGRVKTVAEKKITKTFRLKPEAASRLRELAKSEGRTETEILERKILKP